MNVKRKFIASLLLSTLVGAGAGAAGAADYSGSVERGFLGTQVQSRPDSTIKIDRATQEVYVNHFGTTRFENDRDENFVWQFDSAMSMNRFPLKAIAPAGFNAGNTQVTVLHPSTHFSR